MLQCVWFQCNESHSTVGIADTAKNVVNLLMDDSENIILKGCHSAALGIMSGRVFTASLHDTG